MSTSCPAAARDGSARGSTGSTVSKQSSAGTDTIRAHTSFMRGPRTSRRAAGVPERGGLPGRRGPARWGSGTSTKPAAPRSTPPRPRATTEHDATLGGVSRVRDERGRRGWSPTCAQGQPLATPVTDKGLVLNGTYRVCGYQRSGTGHTVSYTVSAWVRVDPSAAHTLTVLSQTPATASPCAKKFSPFLLSYGGGGDNAWSMRVLSSDGPSTRPRPSRRSSRGVDPCGRSARRGGQEDQSLRQRQVAEHGGRRNRMEGGRPAADRPDDVRGRLYGLLGRLRRTKCPYGSGRPDGRRRSPTRPV